MPRGFDALGIISLGCPDFLDGFRLLQPNLVLPPSSIVSASDLVEALRFQLRDISEERVRCVCVVRYGRLGTRLRTQSEHAYSLPGFAVQ
jgi:hypothetical protein